MPTVYDQVSLQALVLPEDFSRHMDGAECWRVEHDAMSRVPV